MTWNLRHSLYCLFTYPLFSRLFKPDSFNYPSVCLPPSLLFCISPHLRPLQGRCDPSRMEREGGVWLNAPEKAQRMSANGAKRVKGRAKVVLHHLPPNTECCVFLIWYIMVSHASPFSSSLHLHIIISCIPPSQFGSSREEGCERLDKEWQNVILSEEIAPYLWLQPESLRRAAPAGRARASIWNLTVKTMMQKIVLLMYAARL